ncbi:flavin reductase family protein [Azospirillum halopraeferens]|uniref:flavin reductase family protein n=1 Tax=Azospirillum halopraeferens TaxID=34010 RepID=UPI00040841BE|nr:flavin reductase family protein [Azospirillum halopraeferens]
MTIDSRAFRSALGTFATGIAVITAECPDGTPVGVTVNSFSSVSLDPPLVLFCLGRASRSFDLFVHGTAFAVNILAAEQQELSARFARRDDQDRWEGVGIERWETGAPILTGCLANLDCTREAVYDGGDHVILVGRVRRLASRDDGNPLLYVRGGYATLG